MDYCNGVQGFINFVTFIPRNFTGGSIKCPCRKCQNKKYLHLDVVMMHLLHKRFMKDYLCWYAHKELFVHNESMDKEWLGQLLVLAMCMELQMNQGNVSQCPIVEEEANVDAIMFFDMLKDSDKPLWDGYMNHNKLSTVAQVFTIKSDHGLSEAGYDKIIEWGRNILPERNRLKDNFYIAKFMMKPLNLRYQKIDICPNFCMLHYIENVELTECMTCGHSHYKPITRRGKTLMAYKKLKYFPIISGLQRLFMSPRTAEHMT